MARTKMKCVNILNVFGMCNRKIKKLKVACSNEMQKCQVGEAVVISVPC